MNSVQGFWPQGWGALAQTFEQNFAEYGETGASLSVVQQGVEVASLWAGTRDFSTTMPWEKETCVNVFSAGKALVAATLHRTGLDIQKPISHYWPEFTGQGKENITVAHVLNHQSGLSAFHPRVKEHVIFNLNSVLELICYETPWWSPGCAQGYSPFIYGWILAEVIRRVTKAQDFNEYFQKTLAEPLGLRCYFGVPEAQQSALADVRALKRASTQSVNEASSFALGQRMKKDPRGVINQAFSNPSSLMTSTNSSAWRSAVIPAANCHTNAHSLATFYGAMAMPAGLLFGVTEKVTAQKTVAVDDRVLGLPLRFRHGFMLSQNTPDCLFGGAHGFGHPGAGGSLGFVDAEAGLGFGYVTSRLGQSLLIDTRAQRLIKTLYTLLPKEA